MKQKIEREWKSIVCPELKERSLVMCEWALTSEKGHVLKKTLKQVDCWNPKLAEFGEPDCHWGCEKVITKMEKEGR